MNLDLMALLVDGSDVDIRMEGLIGKGKDIRLACLRLDTKVEVTSIVPSTDIHSRNDIPCIVFRQAGLLGVAVDMVADDRHAGIVHVTGIMPDTVFLADTHVTHLHWEEILDDRLPHTTVVDIGSDTEDGRLRFRVPYLIKTWLADITEVYFQITIAQELTPYGRLDGLGNSLTLGTDTNQLCLCQTVFTGIRLNDGLFLLHGMIAYLGGLHHRTILPVADDIRRYHPLHSTLRRTSFNLTAQHEPPVVMVHTSVIEFQRLRQRLYRQLAIGVVGTGGEYTSYGIGSSNQLVCRIRTVAYSIQMVNVCLLPLACEEITNVLVVGRCRQHGRIRLLRVDTRLIIHQPRFAKQPTREELQVKAHLP